MDRNFFFAMALSFFVLLAYQGLFVVPKQQELLKKSQVIKDKEVTEIQSKPEPTEQKLIEKPTKTSIKEEKWAIKTTELNLEFNNVGGTLHKIDFNQGKAVFPVADILLVKGLEEAPFILKQKDDKGISYVFEDDQMRVIKRFNVEGDSIIKAGIEITNKSISRLENIVFKSINVDKSVIDPKDNRNTMLDEISSLENNKVIRKSVANKFTTKDNKTSVSSVSWTGFRDHFHMLIVKPEFETKTHGNEVVSETYIGVLLAPKEGIGSKETRRYDFTIIAGNQDIKWLKTFNQGFEKIVAFSNYWILDMPAKGIYYLALALHFICKSWGLSIILVSLVIYGLTYPLTLKSMASMKKMQMIQPKVAALQKRYKDDPKKLNSEMVDIYRREGVNPLAGCLPFLLQMPIFIALYQALWRSYYFQGESFLWIKDLTMPDRLFILPFDLPFLGNEFNILPIAMGAVMFLQQSISSKNMVITDETQAMQQKMMKYFFPVFIGFIFYKFASGLSLYFTVFYALSAWTQWKVAKSK